MKTELPREQQEGLNQKAIIFLCPVRGRIVFVSAIELQLFVSVFFIGGFNPV